VADAVIAHCPHLVTDIRGEGLLIGIEFVSPGVATEFLMALLDARVIPSYSHNSGTVLRLTPPAILGAGDLDWLGSALQSAARHISRAVPAAA
jgi:putrescine aminotransferase